MRSGASCVRLPEPFGFFIDRSLGGEVVASALRDAGEHVIVHADEFDDDAADVDWLGTVGKKRWVVLTKDARIRTNALEREACLHDWGRSRRTPVSWRGLLATRRSAEISHRCEGERAPSPASAIALSQLKDCSRACPPSCCWCSRRNTGWFASCSRS